MQLDIIHSNPFSQLSGPWWSPRPALPAPCHPRSILVPYGLHTWLLILNLWNSKIPNAFLALCFYFYNFLCMKCFPKIPSCDVSISFRSLFKSHLLRKAFPDHTTCTVSPPQLHLVPSFNFSSQYSSFSKVTLFIDIFLVYHNIPHKNRSPWRVESR